MAPVHRRSGRNPNFLLMSVAVHLALLVIFSFLMISQSKWLEQEAVQVDLLAVVAKTPTVRRRPPKTLETPPLPSVMPSELRSSQSTPRNLAETIQQSQRQLTHDATLNRTYELTDRLPDLTTAAENLRTSESSRISRAMSTRELPGSGDAMLGFRQRAGGEDAGGLALVAPTKIAPIELPDEGIPHQEAPTPGQAERTPFGDALFQIGEHIASTNTTGMVDVVFIVDTSKSMQDNVAKVARELYQMTDAFDRRTLDYRLGVVEFSVRAEGNRILREPLTEDPAVLQKRMQMLRVSGDEHALDALMNALTYLEFRGSSERHFILVTDEPASTGWQAVDSYPKLRKQILDGCRQKHIAVNVLGYAENYQRNLANLTGGLWQEIPGGQRDSQRSQVVVSSEQSMQLFRDMARRVWQFAQPATELDIVVMVDYSSSMSKRAGMVTEGLEIFEGMLSRYPVNVQYAIVRFAEQPDNIGGLKGYHISQIPVEPDALSKLMQYPFVGNERLLDTVVHALPDVRFRPSSAKALVILTDEPSSGNASSQQALQVCQDMKLNVYTLGCLPAGVSVRQLEAGEAIRTTEFQVMAPVQTGGFFYTMPGGLSLPDETQ